MEKEIIWNKKALANFIQALEWISRHSFNQAEILENSILEKLDKIAQNPEMCPLDKFKKDNDGSYRAFETNNYRVAYRFTKTQIQILRLRHVKQEPKEY